MPVSELSRYELAVLDGRARVMANSYGYPPRTCDGCGRTDREDIDGLTRPTWGDGFNAYCPSCEATCRLCGERGYNEYYYSDGFDNYCETCSNPCEQCGTLRFDNHSCVDCDCDDDESRDSGYINSYSYKPSPIFYPPIEDGFRLSAPRNGQFYDSRNFVRNDESGRRITIPKPRLAYFGIELETECEGSLQSAAKYAFDQSNDEKLFYLKEDGSLDRGFELVTHPRTYESWLEFADSFKETLNGLRDFQVKAWMRSNCGLHVHVSRIAFNGPSHVARFVYLFAHDQEDFIRFAKRKSNYARFSGLATDLVSKVKDGYNVGHFDAVNLSNEQTIEVRIFRPSLSVGRLIAAIGLCHAALEYSRLATMRDITSGAFNYEGLMAYMESQTDAGLVDYSKSLHANDGGKF